MYLTKNLKNMTNLDRTFGSPHGSDNPRKRKELSKYEGELYAVHRIDSDGNFRDSTISELISDGENIYNREAKPVLQGFVGLLKKIEDKKLNN